MKIPSAEFWYDMGVLDQGIRELETEVKNSLWSNQLAYQFELIKQKSEKICSTIYEKEEEEDAR